MLQQQLNRNIHTVDIETLFQAVEPFIEQIAENEKGKLHPAIQTQLAYYLDITTDEHRKRLTDKFPKSFNYAHGDETEPPKHEDHWTEASLGDVVRKTGWHYESNVENGHYYVVLECNQDHVVVLDVDGQLKTLCFPEEYEVVGNIQTMLEDRKQKIRSHSKKINIQVWEKQGLASYERETVDTWLKNDKVDNVIDYFTENWKTYYDFGVEQSTNESDLFSQWFGKKPSNDA